VQMSSLRLRRGVVSLWQIQQHTPLQSRFCFLSKAARLFVGVMLVYLARVTCGPEVSMFLVDTLYPPSSL